MRIFISSTFVDLKAYRQAVYDSVIGSELAADNMIYWSADERSPTNVSIDRVRQSDAVILLLAHRYGYVAEGAQRSITEQEYEAAKAAKIPVLAFLIDEAIPWPPQHIEWDRREELLAFKTRVASEVAAKAFTGPDHLASLVSQALAGLRIRRASSASLSTWKSASLRVDCIVDAALQPDINLHIGLAEDGLPLIVSVKRSRDCTSALNSLERLATRPGFDPPTALLSSFRQLIEEHAREAGRSQAITHVLMRDGSFANLLVCGPNLSILFKSSLASLLECRSAPKRSFRKREGTRGEPLQRLTAASVTSQPLQSEGGRNRFLGISLRDGRCYSVGVARTPSGFGGGTWVEWRPFLAESLFARFPDCTFVIGEQTEVRKEDYFEALAAAASSSPSSAESIYLNVGIKVPKRTIAQLFLEVAIQIASLSLIHGDLKPENILITSDGAGLIDSFDVAPGQIAPGWTPSWSAPEQALGATVCFESDVFPFGSLICELLEGHLVGEVRKFKVAYPDNDPEDFDLFYNPTVRVFPAESDQSLWRREWLNLARRCLRFNPDERPSRGSLVEELKTLLERFPPEGYCRMQMRQNLTRVSFPGGVVAIARRIICDMTTQEKICCKCMATNLKDAKYCQLCSSPLAT